MLLEYKELPNLNIVRGNPNVMLRNIILENTLETSGYTIEKFLEYLETSRDNCKVLSRVYYSKQRLEIYRMYYKSSRILCKGSPFIMLPSFSSLRPKTVGVYIKMGPLSRRKRRTYLLLLRDLNRGVYKKY